ncbi:LysR family transcriptional regulator [Roseibium sp. RKSG952]|uniref:LysR family transcriptional regulator n=1 Tax=Roseibium sp. RKSG952 TaxID=2529384 RepID=UPI0012BCA965|nr:LysR family transcriptional regulator [Roseibium sp. RKSG952]MTH99872.1 LysR family transcriptional regulator [Roseibium sp. RKSG952]
MISLRQMKSVVAVAEEGSFTRAASREHATQSGISQHVTAAEESLGVRLFERAADGVVLTAAGERYYCKALQVLHLAEEAVLEAQAEKGILSGPVRAGIMPVLAQSALAPALERVADQHPNVKLQVIESYSGVLTERVRAGDLDFAIVPACGKERGLKTSPIVRDREMLVGGAKSGIDHEKPVRLQDLAPLKLITPTAANVRKARIEEYLISHGVQVASLLEIDAMLGTLDLVARSDWVTILPSVICAPDLAGGSLRVAPLTAPPLYLDLVHIEPARRPLSPQAGVFLQELCGEISSLIWKPGNTDSLS